MANTRVSTRCARMTSSSPPHLLHASCKCVLCCHPQICPYWAATRQPDGSPNNSAGGAAANSVVGIPSWLSSTGDLEVISRREGLAGAQKRPGQERQLAHDGGDDHLGPLALAVRVQSSASSQAARSYT